MKVKNHIVLMADIIKSRKSDQKRLMEDFSRITECINKINSKQLLSPLTITLGDEFQGVVKSVFDACTVIFTLEEEIIRQQVDFKLRYVLTEGTIDTPINPEIAYGMLGEGLSKARKALQESKNEPSRFHIELLNSSKSQALNNSFLIYQTLINSWNVKKDHELIIAFLTVGGYKQVAEKLGKTRSQIWKREKSLKINEYIAIKEIIHYIGN